MKRIFTILLEDVNSAKSFNLSYRSFNKSAKPAYVLWEKVSKDKINITSYFKSFATPEMDKLFDNSESGYIRSLIINMDPSFLIFTWSGKILHEEIARGLKANASKLKIPTLDYVSLYESTMEGYFQTNWCFPIVYDEGVFRSNLSKQILKDFDKEEKVKSLFKLSDQQWNEILKNSW